MSAKFKIALLLAILVSCVLIYVILAIEKDSNTIDFNRRATFNEVISKASEVQKIVFFDAYTSWCGPCRKMDKTTFKDEEVIRFFKEHFVAYKMDVDAPKAQDIAKKYQVYAYPTYLFINAEGTVIHKATGYLDAKKLIRISKKVINGDQKGYNENEIKSIGLNRLYDNYIHGKNKHTAYKRIKQEMVKAIYNEEAKKISIIYAFANSKDKSGKLKHRLRMDSAIIPIKH